jgi:MoxR-like ATPase
VSGDGWRFAAGAQRHDAATAALGVAEAARVPVLLWGAPGTGKTSTIRARCMGVVASLLGDDAPDAPDWARAVRVPAG